tara:strand:- start:1524 stop:2018 length:495 start_codon:yes stop_codon:yes gene_type:complete
MAIASEICNSFKEEILQGGHNLNATGSTPAGNTIMCALYSSNSASLGKATTVWAAASVPTADPTDTYEVTTTGSGYASGGKALTAIDPTLSGDSAVCDFTNESWTSASFTARGLLLYNSTNITGFTNERAILAINFGGDKTVTSGTFTIEFPSAAAGTAILEIT